MHYIQKTIIAFSMGILLLFPANNIHAQTYEIPEQFTMDELFNMPLKDLMNIKVITASKNEEKVSEVPASVVVITREEIEQYGYSDYTEILQYVTGMYMIDDYYWLGNKNFGVRGFFSTGPFNDMVILVNGVSQLSDKYSDYPDVKINVPVEAIDRIEIIRGPMSVIYGSGAFFGAINIITNKTTEEDNTDFVSASYGSYNSDKLNTRFSGNSEDFSFVCNIGLSKTDGIDVPFTDMTSNKNILNYVGLDSNATTNGQKNDQRKYLSLYLNYKQYFFNMDYIETQKDVFDAQPSSAIGSEMSTKASNFTFGYAKDWSKDIKGKISVGYYSHNHFLNYEIFRPYYYEIDAQNTNSVELNANALITTIPNVEMSFGLHRRTTLDIYQASDFGYYGLDYGDGEIGLPSDQTFSNHAVYSQVKYNILESLSIIGGLRLEHIEEYDMYYSRGTVSKDDNDNRNPDSTGNRRIIQATYNPENNGFSLVPRIAMIYKLNENNVFKLLYGQAEKKPSFTENYRQLPDDLPQLSSAKISTIELNYILSTRIFNLSISSFYNRIDNLISSTNIYDNETGEWDIYSSNSGDMRTRGIELSINHSPYKSLRINLSASYQKNKNFKEGYEDIEMGYSPEFLAYGHITYLFNSDISLALSGRYIGEMKTLWKTETTPDAGYRIGQDISSYYIADINFRWNNIIESDIFINIKLNNLFDTTVRYPTTTSNKWADKGTIGLGRRIMITLGYDF